MKHYLKFVISNGSIVSETVLSNMRVESNHSTGVSVWEFIVATYTGTLGTDEREVGPIYYAMWDGEKAV